MESNYDLGQATLNYDTTFLKKFHQFDHHDSWSMVHEARFSKISKRVNDIRITKW